jgi:hypothetical protein
MQELLPISENDESRSRILFSGIFANSSIYRVVLWCVFDWRASNVLLMSLDDISFSPTLVIMYFATLEVKPLSPLSPLQGSRAVISF